MLRNYFKTAWRNLIKSKLYSSINIVGLATGMAVAILIGLWIWDELSFDAYHKNRQEVAQVMYNGSYKDMKWTNNVISMPYGNALRQRYGSDLKYVSLVTGNGEHIIDFGDKKLTGSGPWVEKDFPNIFSLVMRKGNRDALKSTSAILISESMATALFGKDDPMNKVVKIDNEINFSVGGVYEDLPKNTTFTILEFFCPLPINTIGLIRKILRMIGTIIAVQHLFRLPIMQT